MNEQERVAVRNEREKKIFDQIRELEQMCFGLYKELVPRAVKTEKIEAFYVKGLSEKLAKESVGSSASANEFAFYNAFYQTTMFYLLSMCNEDDQIFLSLLKIAKTFSPKESVPLSQTIFGIMVGDIDLNVLNEKDKINAEECLACYKELMNLYEEEMKPESFLVAVDRGIKGYVEKQEYACFTSEKKFSEVLRILKEACWETYFTVYQRWGTD